MNVLKACHFTDEAGLACEAGCEADLAIAVSAEPTGERLAATSEGLHGKADEFLLAGGKGHGRETAVLKNGADEKSVGSDIVVLTEVST